MMSFMNDLLAKKVTHIMFKPRAHTSTHNRCTIGKAIHEYMLTVICGRILAFKFNVKNIRRIFSRLGRREVKQSKHKCVQTKQA